MKLGEICEFTYGDSLPSRSRNKGAIPVYGSNGIVGYHDRAITCGQAIVIGRKGSIGEIHFSPVACFPIDTTYYIEHSKPDVDLMWLFHGLKFLKLQNLNRAAAVPGLNRDDAYALQIPLPPLDEQQRITARLNEQMAAVESARRAAESQLQAARELPTAYLRDVFESEDARKWAKTTIRQVCSIHAGQHILESDYNRQNKGIGYLTGPADFGELYPIIVRWTEKPKAWCEPTDILVTVKGAGVGKINFAPEEKVAIGRQLMAVRPNPEKLTREFLYHVLATHFSRLKGTALGSTVPGLGKNDIANLPILLPGLTEQKAIVRELTEQLDTTNVIVKNIESQLVAINLLPAALLRQAFSGELR